MKNKSKYLLSQPISFSKPCNINNVIKQNNFVFIQSIKECFPANSSRKNREHAENRFNNFSYRQRLDCYSNFKKHQLYK